MLDGPTVTSLSFFSKGHLFLICATNQNNPHMLKYVSYDRLRLLHPCGKCFSWAPRAANNGWSTDNVRPDRRLDRSNFRHAGHFWIQTLYFPYSCRLMLYNAAMIPFFFDVFCCFALNPSKKRTPQ